MKIWQNRRFLEFLEDWQMRFVDEAVITVEAGDGGNGVAVFAVKNLYHLVAQMVVRRTWWKYLYSS